MNCSALQLRAKNSILFGKWCMCRNNSECEWPSAAYGPKILNWEDFESCNVVVLAAAYIEMICRHYSSSRELYLRRCIARVSFLPVTNHSMRDHIFLVLKSIFHWMGGLMLGLLLPLLLAHFFSSGLTLYVHTTLQSLLCKWSKREIIFPVWQRRRKKRLKAGCQVRACSGGTSCQNKGLYY